MTSSHTRSTTRFQSRNKKLNQQINKLNAHGLTPSAIGVKLKLSLPVVKHRLRRLGLTSNQSTVRRVILVRKLKPIASLGKTARYLRQNPKARAIHLERMRQYKLAHPEKNRDSVKRARLKKKQFILSFYGQNACPHKSAIPNLDHVHEAPHAKCGMLHRLSLRDTRNDCVYRFVAAVIKKAPKPLRYKGQRWTTKDFQLLCAACNSKKAKTAAAAQALSKAKHKLRVSRHRRRSTLTKTLCHDSGTTRKQRSSGP
jgi:hypothetical protein